MSDVALRALEREAAQGDGTARKRLLLARQRTGEVAEWLKIRADQTGDRDHILDEYLEEVGWSGVSDIRRDIDLVLYLKLRPEGWADQAIELLDPEEEWPRDQYREECYALAEALDAKMEIPSKVMAQAIRGERVGTIWEAIYSKLAILAAERRDYDRALFWERQLDDDVLEERELAMRSCGKISAIAARHGDYKEAEEWADTKLHLCPSEEERAAIRKIREEDGEALNFLEPLVIQALMNGDWEQADDYIERMNWDRGGNEYLHLRAAHKKAREGDPQAGIEIASRYLTLKWPQRQSILYTKPSPIKDPTIPETISSLMQQPRIREAETQARSYERHEQVIGLATLARDFSMYTRLALEGRLPLKK